MEKERVVEFFKSNFFPDTYDAIYQGKWNGFDVYSPRYPKGLRLGEYNFGIVKENLIRMATLDEALSINDELDL
ncbi:MAG: hypothetical protein E7Z70_01945 [Thermoplasmata archaeon]|nr:hypothetical protein [Thermoplasmata archaeon]